MFRDLYYSSLVFVISYFLFSQLLFSQTDINPDNITIVRDSWGVPHVYAPTDVELAYGFAWATAEDDFKTMQENLLAVRSQSAKVSGKNGAIMDAIAFLAGIKELVDSTYHKSLSPEYKALVTAYAKGVNAYGKAHPKEVLIKDMLPVTEKDIIGGYVLGMMLITNVHFELIKLFNHETLRYEDGLPKGSNAIAISKNRNPEGETLLAINSHQPLKGPYAWYEAHLVSDEGINTLGATFPGGIDIFAGATENLAWAHTVNFPDHCDIYKLTMHPSKKGLYKFDGEWLPLKKRTLKMKVKVGPIRLPIKKSFYWSKYGPTLKNKHGYYSMRFQANLDIRGAEQWHCMNKATDFESFKACYESQKQPGLNTVYADKEDNLYFLSNGQYPYRNPAYDWRQILPGDTSATLWPIKYHPLSELPSVTNPSCGYLINTNNSPFSATCEKDNFDASQIDPTMGFATYENNRSIRLHELIRAQEKISYADLKRIKYDLEYASPLYTNMMENLEDLLHLDPKKYPDLAPALKLINEWDRKATIDSEGASIINLMAKYTIEAMIDQGRALDGTASLKEEQMVDALKYAKKHLTKHFGSIYVKLGDLQRHERGDVSLPIAGSPDVVAAMYTEDGKKGKIVSFLGESYIELVRFGEDGVKIETIHPYGASNKADSPHYTDQMELFTQQKLKTMTLDKETIFKEAKRIYNPK